ncbi:ribosome-recycling factor [bacterium]|nr:ribosome-recycling factor [bacterium]
MSIEDINLEFGMGRDAALEYLEGEYVKIQTGRATIAAFESVTLEIPSWEGSFQLRELGGLALQDPLTISLSLYDASITPEVERALQAANLGVSIAAKEGRIFLTVPMLSGERRKELVKVAERVAEECRISMRNHRRDARTSLSALTSEVGEDAVRRAETSLESEVAAGLEGIAERLAAKTAAILGT